MSSVVRKNATKTWFSLEWVLNVSSFFLFFLVIFRINSMPGFCCIFNTAAWMDIYVEPVAQTFNSKNQICWISGERSSLIGPRISSDPLQSQHPLSPNLLLWLAVAGRSNETAQQKTWIATQHWETDSNVIFLCTLSRASVRDLLPLDLIIGPAFRPGGVASHL